MKLAVAVLSGIVFLGGLFANLGGDEQVVILSGDTQGYLSPCGCSYPMMGGIRRRATVIRKYAIPGHTTLLENGGMIDGSGVQDEMKAETLMQSMFQLGVTAVNLGPSESRLGVGGILQLSQLSGERLVSSSLENPEDRGIKTFIPSGPFLVGGATDHPDAFAGILGQKPIPIHAAVESLVQAASEQSLKPILMLQGSHESAVKLAHEFPGLALIQYSSIGTPPSKLEWVGSTALATTGEHGKHLIRAVFKDGTFSDFRVISLGPEFPDDPTVSRYYATYLKRVKDGKLLDKLPRSKTNPYAGSLACKTCHAQATHVWEGSAHRRAYATLEKLSHEVDPDCVSCHVVGLSSTSGFRSKAATPQFASVGCESCHGPALGHARSPKKVKLPTLTSKACIGCHNPLNSPNFDFKAYWPKVAHR